MLFVLQLYNKKYYYQDMLQINSKTIELRRTSLACESPKLFLGNAKMLYLPYVNKTHNKRKV